MVCFADIDECTASADICGEAHCKNLISSYECLCDAGYKYDDVRKTCQGKLKKYVSIYYTI